MRVDRPREPRDSHEPVALRVEEMRARSAWSRIRYFTPHQRLKAARETRSLRTVVVAQIALTEAFAATRSEPKLAEEWAAFGIQLLELIPSRELAAQQRRERLGDAYTTLGNARRVSGDYEGAATAIQAAYGFLEGCKNTELANLYSIHASLAYDMGRIESAGDLISQGFQIYSELRNRHGIARLGIKHANFLREIKPAEARKLADDALLVVPRSELRLEMLGRCIITECLVEAHEGRAALSHLEGARPLINQFKEMWLEGRVQFLEARILEALGFIADAERLYTEVARFFWFREMYRESFMVRLRLFEFYLGRTRIKEAAEVCRKAVVHLGEIRIHAQMKEVWQRLFEAAEAQALKVQVLPIVRDYMVRHWAMPAECPPAITA